MGGPELTGNLRSGLFALERCLCDLGFEGVTVHSSAYFIVKSSKKFGLTHSLTHYPVFGTIALSPNHNPSLYMSIT